MTFPDKLALYNDVLISTLDEFAPLQQTSSWKSGQSVSLPQWMDAEYRKQRSLRRKFERQWKKYGGEETQRDTLNSVICVCS